ncbi:MAG: nucleotidyltransferase family protein [Pseudomonadota bacterium]
MTPPARAMVFAAGFGTRMGALTVTRPKPLLPVAGRPLIVHALERLAEAAVAEAVVNLHYRAPQLRARLAGWARPRLAFSEERPEILETAGGLRAALSLLGAEPVATLNPDGLWFGPNPIATLGTAWEPARMEALLLLVPRAAAGAHGGPGDFFLDAAGRLVRRGSAEAAPLVYTGAQILATGRVAARPPGALSLNPVWDEMIAAGRAFGIVYDGRWIDVGRPEGLALAERLVRGGAR